MGMATDMVQRIGKADSAFDVQEREGVDLPRVTVDDSRRNGHVDTFREGCYFRLPPSAAGCTSQTWNLRIHGQERSAAGCTFQSRNPNSRGIEQRSSNGVPQTPFLYSRKITTTPRTRGATISFRNPRMGRDHQQCRRVLRWATANPKAHSQHQGTRRDPRSQSHGYGIRISSSNQAIEEKVSDVLNIWESRNVAQKRTQGR